MRIVFFNLLLLFTLAQCSANKNYQLRESNPELKKYENTSLDPLLVSPYSHSIFKLPIYDTYLEEAYRTIISVRFSQTAIQEAEENYLLKKQIGEKGEAFLFAYRELPLLQVRLEKLHVTGLEYLALLPQNESISSDSTRSAVRNELNFTVSEIQYMQKQISTSIRKSKELFSRLYPAEPKQKNTITATKLKIHNPHENKPLFLSSAEDQCYASRAYRQWFILYGSIRMGDTPLEELFPDPNQSYRFEEKTTIVDFAYTIFFAPLTTITTKTIRVDACDSASLADYRKLQEERDLYKTLLAQKKEEENKTAVVEAETREVPEEESFYMKRVAMIQLNDGTVIQGDIKSFSLETITLEMAGETRNIEKQQIDRIRYTRIKVDTEGKPI
ncbi:LIC_13076 family protein [Leptospira idonii]|uniref:Uncharacterized protein n=1 Tax=Leptospira idonii TaxID=1193500 RepID=A0A4R9LXQ7_9LEPT|nr:hypothetical protein [Leptospira idonii]TGN19060.1 hypothetical protein EHS15_11675 [Leptospira idonii]